MHGVGFFGDPITNLSNNEFCYNASLFQTIIKLKQTSWSELPQAVSGRLEPDGAFFSLVQHC